MGTRATRPAKSAAVHQLRGNPGKHGSIDSKAAGEVHAEVALPPAPSYLLPLAKKEWKRVGKELKENGLVSRLDIQMLAAYCQSYAKWREVEEQLAKLGPDAYMVETPNGFLQPNPLLRTCGQLQEQMRKFAIEFGLTPAARARVRPSQAKPKKNDADGKKDPVDDYLSRY